MSKSSIWIAESEEATIANYRERLSSNFCVSFFRTLSALEEALNSLATKPVMLLAECDLPDGTIVSLLKKKSFSQNKIPTFVIANNDSQKVIHNCLDFGAIDYLCKPVNYGELIAKIERRLENPNQIGTALLNSNHLSQLTLKELRIFSILQSAQENYVPRCDIIKFVWEDVLVSPKSFDVHLFHLRKKLWKMGYQIQFSPSSGYRLVSR